MALNVVLPQLGSRGAGTKDLIISILSHEWPLSAKELHSKIVGSRETEVSYQAVHKGILELEGEGVIERAGRAFQLRSDWIENLKTYATDLEENYTSQGTKYKIPLDFTKPITLKFNDMNLFAWNMAEIFSENTLAGNGENSLVGTMAHAWFPFGFRFNDFNLVAKMVRSNKKGVYCAILGNLPFDKYVANFYRKAGFNVAVGITDSIFEYSVVAKGDTIIETKPSPETTELIENIYSNTNTLTGYFKEFTRQLLKKHEVDITVTFTKNPQLAKVLRKQIMTYFEDDVK